MKTGRRMRSKWIEASLVPPGRLAWGRRLPAAGPIGRAIGFRRTCVEAGGLYRVFAIFLAGRADLVPAAFTLELSGLEWETSPELPLEPEIAVLVDEPSVVESTPLATVYRARFRDGPVTIEVFPPIPPGFDDQAFDDFRLGVSYLEQSPEEMLGRDSVHSEFREWLHLVGDVGRKRRMLENLVGLPDGTLTLVPNLVPELQASRTLSYWQAGPRVEAASRAGPTGLHRTAEGLLEQALSLAFVPARSAVRLAALTDDGRVTYPVWPAMSPVPVQYYHSFLQYVASSVADEIGRGMRALHRMSRFEGSEVPEAEIWRALSGLRFEVGSHREVPESIERMVNFWRSFGASGSRLPLFIHLFHQQFNLLGQEAAGNSDPVAASVWPVFGRILRTKLGSSVELKKAREWSMAGGLLGMGLVRQMGGLLEQIRENDLSVTVSTTGGGSGAGGNRSRPRLVTGLILLVVFLVSLQLALALGGTGAVLLSALAAAAGLLLAAAVVRRPV